MYIHLNPLMHLKKVSDHKRLEDIELEMTAAATDRYGHVVSHNLQRKGRKNKAAVGSSG